TRRTNGESYCPIRIMRAKARLELEADGEVDRVRQLAPDRAGLDECAAVEPVFGADPVSESVRGGVDMHDRGGQVDRVAPVVDRKAGQGARVTGQVDVGVV